MNPLSKLYTPVLALLLLCGCTALRKSQSEAVQSLAASAKLLAEAVPDLHKKYYELEMEPLRHDAALSFLLNSFDTAAAGLHEYDEQEKAVDETLKEMSGAYASLAQFAEVLQAIADSRHYDSLKKSNTAFKTSVEAVINFYDTMQVPAKRQPASLAKLVYSFIDLTGGRLVKHKQLKLLQDYLRACRTDVYGICNMVKTDVAALSGFEMEKSVLKSFKTYYRQLIANQPGAGTFVYTEEKVIPYYRGLQAKLRAAGKLMAALPKTADAFIAGFDKTNTALYEKMNFSELKESIKQLHSSFKEVKDIYDAYKKEKESIRETKSND